MTRPFSPETLAERIARSSPEDCWIWKGQLNHNGYGILMARGKPRRYLKVTHIMLEEAGFPRPPRAHALHSCDNPSCVNPAHLRWGTHQENIAEAAERGRIYRPIGSLATAAKLDEELVRLIRQSTEKGRTLAKRLGISETAISRARRRITWGHVK